MIKKILAVAGLLAVGIFVTAPAYAAIVNVPEYTDVVNTTSTAFAQGLVTDLLPWAAAFIAIIVGTLALKAIYGKVVAGAKRLMGGRRGGRRRRR